MLPSARKFVIYKRRTVTEMNATIFSPFTILLGLRLAAISGHAEVKAIHGESEAASVVSQTLALVIQRARRC